MKNKFLTLTQFIFSLILATILFSTALLWLTYASPPSTHYPPHPPHHSPPVTPLLFQNPIIITEDFEFYWPPDGGLWEVTGNPTWGNTIYEVYEGEWSVWAGAGGSQGVHPSTSNSKLENLLKKEAI